MSDDNKPSKLCRICLTSNVKMYMSIFEKYREFTVNDYILLLTNVDIKREDGFPEKICATCFMEFETALNFKQKCENSDTFLKSSRDKIIEACANADLEEIIIVKKEEPYQAEVEFEEAPDEGTEEYYGVEALDDADVPEKNHQNNLKSFASRAIDLKLKCHDCGNLFKSKCKLRVHWHQTHNLAPIVCDICKREFKTYNAYHTHRTKPTKSCRTVGTGLVKVEGQGRERMFHCKQCDYKSNRIKDLSMHILIHSGHQPYEYKICKKEPFEAEVEFAEAPDESTKEYYGVEALNGADVTEQNQPNHVKPFVSRAIDLKLECHDCGNLFKSKCKLRVHWHKTHKLAAIVCDTCKRQFKTYKAYHTHRTKPTKSCKTVGTGLVKVEGQGRVRMFHCKQCDYKSKRIKDLSMHILIHSGDRPYECKICKKNYTQQSSLQSHMEGRHKKYIKEITCHICGKHILGRVRAYRHMQRHTEPKYPCPVCQKMFNKRALKQHMLRHGDTKTFTCEKCASTFYTLGELCNHRRWVHNKQKDAYKCDLCDYTASRKDRIKIHKRNHTDTNVPCLVCGMFFPNLQKMENHKKQHYAEKTVECSYCDTKFHRPDSLRKHISSKHKWIVQAVKERTISATKKVKNAEDDNKFKIKIGKLFKQEGG